MLYDYIKCGDCVELMKELPDNCIDLTVTSPPYDNLREYNGFIWIFKEDYDPFNKIQYKRMGRHREVVQLSLNNDYIAEFESIKYAATSIDGNEGYISACCKGNKRYYKGYKWMYKEDWDKLQLTMQDECEGLNEVQAI